MLISGNVSLLISFLIPLFKFSEAKVSEKKKLSEKIKEKENRLKKKQQELKVKEKQENVSFVMALTGSIQFTTVVIYNNVFILALLHLLLQQEEPTLEEQLAEKIRVKKLQEDADLELAKDAFGKTPLPFR